MVHLSLRVALTMPFKLLGLPPRGPTDGHHKDRRVYIYIHTLKRQQQLASLFRDTRSRAARACIGSLHALEIFRKWARREWDVCVLLPEVS